MARSFARLFPVLLLLSTAACDGTQMEDSEAGLVGAWLITEASQRDVVTASQASTVLDLTRPGQGDLMIAGDVSLPLRHLTQLQYADRSDPAFPPSSVALASYPPGESIAPDPNATLFLDRRTGGGAFVQLTVGKDYETRLYSLDVQEQAALTRTGVSLAPIEVWGFDEAGERQTLYTLSGTLTFATVPLPAGVETEIPAQYPLSLDPSAELRHVFEADGTYRSEASYGDNTTSIRGTWSASNGRVRVSIPNRFEETYTVEYAYRVEDGGLTLTTEPSVCPDDCVRARERDLGLAHGVLTSVRPERVYRLTPTTSRTRPLEQNDVTANTLSVDLRARLLPGIEASSAR